MWYKVNKLKSKSFTISQISRELILDRKTVRKYLALTESEFLSSSLIERQVERKLTLYKEEILTLLNFCNDFSSSQIHDRLRESHPDFISVHRNTVNNYVQYLRKEYDIPKKIDDCRVYCQVPDEEYGSYAQVDFGERWIYSSDKKRHTKIYFMVMLLCRSRYKYVYIQTTPFTTKTAVYAHELAFSHFGGIPQNIIYDQDKVFIHKENLGDYILTQGFASLKSKCHFNTVFCRKNDPESKGKVENVVKYVKNNFLRGRTFTDIATLNQECISWMERTANGLKHNKTKLIPAEEFKIEQTYLQPYSGTPVLETEVMLTYKVLKDNTINYRGNFYSVPLGTYKNTNSKVYVTINNTELIILNIETGKTITTHTISSTKGKLISHAVHRKRDRTSIIGLEQKILSEFDNNENVKLYLDFMNNDKPRYYLDNLRYLVKHIEGLDKAKIIKTMILHINNNIYNAEHLVSLIRDKPSENKVQGKQIQYEHLQPETRNLDSYNNLF